MTTSAPTGQQEGEPAKREEVPDVQDREIRPQGEFLTYGIGVPLMRMRDAAAARARVPVT